MGWQDRDYAKQPSRGGIGAAFSRPTMSRFRSVAIILIVVNVAVHIIASMTLKQTEFGYVSPIHTACAMSTPEVLHGQIWRLITSQYLHAGPTHLFVNMLGLYFLGPAIESTWGSRRFFVIYTIAGLLGNIFYLLLNVVGWLPPIPAVGASGCILGLLGAAAVMFPKAEVLVYFLFPVNIRTAALVFGVWYAANLYYRGSNAGGDACHLVGLVFGYWWTKSGQYKFGAPRMAKVSPFGRGQARPRGGFKQRIEQRRRDAATIDRILAKVSTNGMASLSPDERRALQEATERQRVDDQQFGLD